MSARDAAFAAMVDASYRATQATDVELADLRASISDCRIALALANHVPIWALDRNGNIP